VVEGRDNAAIDTEGDRVRETAVWKKETKWAAKGEDDVRQEAAVKEKEYMDANARGPDAKKPWYGRDPRTVERGRGRSNERRKGGTGKQI